MMQGRRLSARQRMWAGLSLAGVGLLIASHFWHVPATTPLLLSAAAAWVATLGGGRRSDAIALAIPPLVGFWVDADVGSPTLLAACLVFYLLTMRPRFAAVAGSTLVALLLTCIGLKKRFAGTTLTWQDIRFFFLKFDDNVAVMASQPTLLWFAMLSPLGLLALRRTRRAGRPWRIRRRVGRR